MTRKTPRYRFLSDPIVHPSPLTYLSLSTVHLWRWTGLCSSPRCTQGLRSHLTQVSGQVRRAGGPPRPSCLMPALSLAPVSISSPGFIFLYIAFYHVCVSYTLGICAFSFSPPPWKDRHEQIWLGIIQIWWKTWNLKFRRLTWGEAKHPHILEKYQRPTESLQRNKRKDKSPLTEQSHYL